MACGLVHAAASLYWAAGGTRLLDTIGSSAVEAVRSSPIGAEATLAAIGLAKVVAAVLPWWAARRPLPRPGLWRPACLAGGMLLAAYGALNVAVASVVLLTPGSDGEDRTALLGHALLWDPLFLAWGVLLVLGLRPAWTLRRSPKRPAPMLEP